MTSYGAYDAGLPCKNSSCKSHGKPHPNCKCYGGFAGGGKVEPFCSSDKMHEKTCEYYAEGGDVVPQHPDPEMAVASYLSHGGLHGLIDGPGGVEKYNQSIKRGSKMLDSRVEHLFGGKGPEKMDFTKHKKSVEDWLEKGGAEADIQDERYVQNNPPNFAAGGEVEHHRGIAHDHEVADTYPDHNVMLHTAKGRMSNYLAALKPKKHAPKLAFDSEPDTRKQEKSYKRALNMAVNPLHVLDKIKEGTIEPEHVKHFSNMHPEVNNALQKKITERITHAQLNGEKPNFHVRQGLSLLMGVPLSGEMTPQNIQAAQSVFAAKQSPQSQPPAKPAHKTSSLSKASQSYLTSDEARIGRQQKQ